MSRRSALTGAARRERAIPEPQPELGIRLRAVRTGAGRSLTEVAAATAISASFLSMVENGGSDISIGRLLRLTQYYEIELSSLLPHHESATGRRRRQRWST